ncbi:PKD domain-containing protein [Cellulomonas soli]|uniref:PKD domain-containing protein n=1 Tax=Cellulomonas soli TaxID=931535 RepID=UPI003F86A526
MTNRESANLAMAAAADPASSPWEYDRGPHCGTGASTGDALLVGCLGEPPVCEDGAPPLMPLFRRLETSTNENDWEQVSSWACPEAAVPAFTAQDLRLLPIAPGTAGINPNTGPLLVNATNVVFTDAGEQQFTTNLLGYTFEVIVTPTSYTWDFADNTRPLVTTDPGAPFRPGDGDRLDEYLTHVYTQPGTAQITLTTTWTGRYRIPDLTDWQDVLGTATTTTTSRALTIEERRTHLVGATCDQEPDAPGCG